METVTIKNSTFKKSGAKNGKPWTITEYELEDGRKVDSFDAFNIGDTAEVEITPNGEYNAKMKKHNNGRQAAATFKNAEVANKAIAENKSKDLRITKLSAAGSACVFFQQRQGTPDDVMKLAERIYNWAIQEKDDLPF